MKRLSTKALVPGMVTAEDVYTYDDQLILPKGLILTDKAITKLEFYSVLSIKVEDEIQPEPNTVNANLSSTPSYCQRIQSSPEYKAFIRHFDTSIEELKTSINDIVEKNAPLDPDALLHQTLDLLQSDFGASTNVLTMLQNMRMYDDMTYVHCMNVALICNIFAGWLHFSKEDIELATLCGLLHDIGKLVIPDNILKKPAKLTENEYSVVQTHCLEGYKILKKYPINEHICNAALMHHERCDGSGYPMGLTLRNIDRFAKLVAIADVYDAMTSARIYRGPLCPFQVIDIFASEGLQKYDPNYYLTFMNNVVTTYLLNRVRLTNGEEGEIVFINQSDPAHPTVKIGSRFVDLSKEKDLDIETII